MRNERLALRGALALATATAFFALPKIMSKGRLAVRRAAGVTHRSGVSNPGVRATADPSRGLPA